MRVDVFSIDQEEESAATEEAGTITSQVVEVMPPQPLGILERANIDMQIATAKQFPRVLSQVLEKARTLACYSPMIASQCTYSLKREGKDIVGPTIRHAEIMATSWGNLRYGGRVLAVGEKTLTCQGVCHDLESNASVSVEAVRRITDREGRRYSDDMITLTSMAGIAIAIRNAIFKIIPGGYVGEVLRAAQKVARGEEQGLEVRLASAIAFFESKGVSKERLFATLGIKGPADVNWAHIDRLLGYAAAIRVEGVSVEEIFGQTNATRPAEPPTPPPAPTMTYPEAGVILDGAGVAWETACQALGISEAGELTDAHRAQLVKWAERIRAGEKPGDVIQAPKLQTPPGPPAGNGVFGKKAEAAQKPAEPSVTSPTPGAGPALDF